MGGLDGGEQEWTKHPSPTRTSPVVGPIRAGEEGGGDRQKRAG